MSAVMNGVVGIGLTFISLLIVDRLGQRVLFVIDGVQMFVSQLMVGEIMAAKLGDHVGLSKEDT
uniref:Major facilitator superfamily (MFS) profile domain-containing protein n=1 Tax=Nelumbo nucifera TaxID=4432 RepID=A0A822ZNW7_NELNU|nr:TPA_asm: hypothetical protein HUJ06_017611 [Nelumbo nucifera]